MSELTFGCEDLEAVSAELALGILSATERAAALEHLAGCTACRAQVEELSEVADALLLTGPEREPPPGFESRVLEAIGRQSEPAPDANRWSGRRWLAAAAAIIVVVGATGAVIGRRTAAGPSALTRQYVAALHVMGGSALAAVRLHTAAGVDAGEVFAYQGKPPWLFVAVRDSAAAGNYTVQAVMQGSGLVTVGRLHVTGDYGSLGTTVDVDVTRLQSVQIIDAGGAVRYSASLAGWLPAWSGNGSASGSGPTATTDKTPSG